MLTDLDTTTPQVQQHANNKRRQSDTPKPSMAVKRAWHAACFQPRERKGADRKWRKLAGQWMPLKTFAKQMKDQVAKTWAANKCGASNASRSDTNIARVATERSASHSSRGK